jgi:hypothetical protein
MNMGRQIHFHMLPEDRNTFLRFARECGPVAIILRDADSSEVQPLADLDIGDGKTLCLWNRKLLPHLERKWIPDPGYYRVEGLQTPTLEFTSSFVATWEGKPALGQGRLFGDFDPLLEKPPDFEKWYETLVRWIRQNYRKNPASTGGYVGPAAFEFYNRGGYLLPNFLPPRTKEWLAEIGKQHSRSKTTLRTGKRSRARSHKRS